jgi:hypothetical protein
MQMASSIYHFDKMVNIASISIELAAFFFRVFEQCTKYLQNVHNFYHFDMAYPEGSYYIVQKFHNRTYVSRCCLYYQNMSSFLITTDFSSIHLNAFKTLLKGDFDSVNLTPREPERGQIINHSRL